MPDPLKLNPKTGCYEPLPLPSDLASARAELSDAVYAATALLERLERAGLISGNADQKRQRIVVAAVEELRRSWVGQKEGEPAPSGL